MSKKLPILLAFAAIMSMSACSHEPTDADPTPDTPPTTDPSTPPGSNPDKPGPNRPSAEKPLCIQGSYRCDIDGIPEKCDNNKWVMQLKCGDNQKCYNGECVDQKTKECDNGGAKCSDAGVPQVCKDEVWVDTTPCDKGKHCVKNTCVEDKIKECTTGDSACDADDMPILCVDEKWVKRGSCGSDQKCLKGDCVAVSVAECNNSAKRCSPAGIPQVCRNEKWVTLSACADDEVCNKKKGVCETVETCFESECQSMTGDLYVGNTCIDGYKGKECGCLKDSDCNRGFTCNTAVGICTKPEKEEKPAGEGICRGHAGRYTCDGDDEVSCSSDGREVSRTNCASQTGSGYTGDTCVELKDEVICGCNSNADCKYGFECGSDKYCVKRSCNPQICQSERSNYLGNACIDSYMEGFKECGCESDGDCKKGYVCDTQFGRCKNEEKPEVTGICGNQPNGSMVCDGNTSFSAIMARKRAV